MLAILNPSQELVYFIIHLYFLKIDQEDSVLSLFEYWLTLTLTNTVEDNYWNDKRIFVSLIHKTYGICIAKCAQAMFTNYKTWYLNMPTFSLNYLIKRGQQLFLN